MLPEVMCYLAEEARQVWLLLSDQLMGCNLTTTSSFRYGIVLLYMGLISVVIGMHNQWLYYIRYAGAFFAIGGSFLLLAVAVKACMDYLTEQARLREEVVQASKVQPPDYVSVADSGLPSYEAAIRLSPRNLMESSSSSTTHLCLPGVAVGQDITQLDISTATPTLPPVYSTDNRTEQYLALRRVLEERRWTAPARGPCLPNTPPLPKSKIPEELYL